jgi:hypothetical protein
MRSEIAVAGHMDKGILTGATGKCLIHPMEDMPVKALYAVVFVLSSLGTPAQALYASTAYCVDDFFGGIPAQIVATEPTIEKLGEAVDEAHGVTITGSKDAANVPVGAIGPSDDATGSGDKPTVDAATEQSTIPAQMVATEPTIEMLGEVVEGADGVDITGPNGAADVRVGAILPNDKTQTWRENKPMVDATTEQKLGEAVGRAERVTIIGPKDAEDVAVGDD